MSILAHGLRAASGNTGGTFIERTDNKAHPSIVASSFSDTGVLLGSPNAQRTIVAIVFGNDGSTSTSNSSTGLTVGGISMTKIFETYPSSNFQFWMFQAVYIYKDGGSLGTSANFSGTFENDVGHAGLVVFRSVGDDVVVYDSYFDGKNNSAATTGSINTLANNGWALYMAGDSNSSSSTVSGWDNSFSFDFGTNEYATIAYMNNTDGTNLTVPNPSNVGTSTNTTIGAFSLGKYNYETDFGTPDYTITSFPSTGAGVGNGSNDALIAIDANISSTDDGVLMEAGGTGDGMSIGVSNGTLRVRGYDGSTAWTSIVDANTAYLEIDISAYTGTFCTYYFAFDTSNSRQLKAYVQVGGKGSANELVSLGTNSAASSADALWGSAGKGYGQANGAIADLGAAYEVNFTGTINEIRYWAEDAALDVSTFGTL